MAWLKIIFWFSEQNETTLLVLSCSQVARCSNIIFTQTTSTVFRRRLCKSGESGGDDDDDVERLVPHLLLRSNETYEKKWLVLTLTTTTKRSLSQTVPLALSLVQNQNKRGCRERESKVINGGCCWFVLRCIFYRRLEYLVLLLSFPLLSIYLNSN